jgi:hypothetical protein
MENVEKRVFLPCFYVLMSFNLVPKAVPCGTRLGFKMVYPRVQAVRVHFQDENHESRLNFLLESSAWPSAGVL